MMNPDSSSDRDALEYPEGDEPVMPRAGSMALLYATDDKLCARFGTEMHGRRNENLGGDISPELGTPPEATPIPAQTMDEMKAAGGSPSYGGYRLYSFDIDNDHVVDTVVARHERANGIQDDRDFTFARGSLPPAAGMEMKPADRDARYEAAATAVLPDDWMRGDSPAGSPQPNASRPVYLVKHASPPWWDEADVGKFWSRDMYLWPFGLDDSTYFLAWPWSPAVRHWYLVLKPEPGRKVTEMCVPEDPDPLLTQTSSPFFPCLS
ncbi:MAG: hypothetical protein HY749_14360 [Gammaproteobacteria bacterium]|nr:hypothetical protein [Gammaproteobacteria bacterium]MBI5615149.1 hypothetical protein [Gammaproteobacteria bacterium]